VNPYPSNANASNEPMHLGYRSFRRVRDLHIADQVTDDELTAIIDEVLLVAKDSLSSNARKGVL
jgi:hypothetical protein